MATIRASKLFLSAFLFLSLLVAGSGFAATTADIRGAVLNNLTGNGLAGWTVYLDANNNGVKDSGEIFNTTLTNGSYTFEDLATPGTYHVREVLQSGWIQTGPSGGVYNITLTGTHDSNNNNFGNRQQLSGNLKVIKHVIDNSGGTHVASDFTMHVSGANVSNSSFAGSESGVSVTLSPGAFSVIETGPSGYSAFTSGNCSGSISAGQNLTCTITNDDQPGTVIVKKHVINSHGGTASASGFTMTVNGTNVSSASFPGNENGTSVTLNAGSYSVNEANAAGYSETLSANCSGTIANGQTVTCTITNNDIAPLLTVNKVVVNSHGGTLVAGQVPLFVDGNSVTNGAQNSFTAGAHIVSETQQPGYSGAFSGDCGANGQVSLAIGDVKTCTITDSDIAPNITIVKTVVNGHGGTLQAGDVPLFVDGTQTSSGIPVSVNAGTHTVSETNPSGYSASSWGGDCAENGQVAVALGESKTCTITDSDQPATLTIVKHVVGFGSASDFIMHITGSNPSQNDFAGSEDGVQVTIDAGSYSVSETGPSGYAESDSEGCSGTLSPGGSATCTITNTAQPASLTVIKHVINDNGGSAVASEFTMNVDGNSVSTPSFQGSEDPGTTVTLNAGDYGVSESGGPQGYSESSSSDCSGTILPGESKTCTITNSAQLPGSVIVHKQVLDPNGQPASDSNQFEIALDNGAPAAFAEGTDAVFNSVTPGSHTLTESSEANYVTSGPVPVTVPENGTVEVTINNTQKAGTITIVKDTVGGDGRFGFTGLGESGSFTILTSGGTGSQSFEGLAPGQFVVSENVPDGWQLTGLQCDTEAGVQANGTTVTINLASNEAVTCTYTDTQNGVITITKSTDGGDGTFDFTGPASEGVFEINTTNGSGQQSFSLAPGTYSTSEIAQKGWMFSGLSCSDGVSTDGASATFSLGAGQALSCGYSNTRQATLTVIKHVINDNGGSASADEFSIHVMTAGEAPADVGGSPQNGSESGTIYTLDPGRYTLSETGGPSGYTESLSGDCNADGVLLAPGDAKTCTITNHDQPGTLTVVKQVTNSHELDIDLRPPSGFTMTVNGTNVNGTNSTSISFPGSDGTGVALDAGPYSVGETADPAYSATYSDGCSGTIANGQAVTCTITNNAEIAAKLTVTKIVINEGGGTKQVSDFPLFVGSTQVDSGVQSVFFPGTYTVSETSDPNYAAAFSGDCDSSGSVALNYGDAKACTMTNTFIAQSTPPSNPPNNGGGDGGSGGGSGGSGGGPTNIPPPTVNSPPPLPPPPTSLGGGNSTLPPPNPQLSQSNNGGNNTTGSRILLTPPNGNGGGNSTAPPAPAAAALTGFDLSKLPWPLIMLLLAILALLFLLLFYIWGRRKKGEK